MTFYKKIITVCCLIMLLQITACKKFVTVDPPSSQLSSVTVFEDDYTAIAAMLNVYAGMSNADAFLYSYYPGLSADEFQSFNRIPETIQVETNSLSPNNQVVSVLWNHAYSYIYQANAVMEGVNNSIKLSAATKMQLKGEAKFARAFWFFYLVNLYGKLPLPLTTQYQANSVIERSPSEQVYQQIATDLNDAIKLLADDYLDAKNLATSEKVRPNKAVAIALLARINLYMQQWQNAESSATEVINDTRFSLNTELNEVFLKNSNEAIWQLMPVLTDRNTAEGSSFIPLGEPEMGLLPSLVQSFEDNDQRKMNWIDSVEFNGAIVYYPAKYKVKSITSGTPYTEYSMVLRLAEQYLIRAEARIQLGDINGALQDINVIRSRAGLDDFVSSSMPDILAAIDHERRAEFFTEWSHRWFDLKRRAIADPILSILKSPNWQPADTLYPIPQNEILINPKLSQNPGY